MWLQVHMKFMKKTKRTTVFGASGSESPVKFVYVNTEALRSRGFREDEVHIVISDAPIVGKDLSELIVVKMGPYKTTKRTTVFESGCQDSAMQTVYVNTEALQANNYGGEEIFLAISQVALIGAALENPRGTEYPKTFEEFLDESVKRIPGSRITTERIWKGWASLHGTNPDGAVIAGVRRTEVPSRFRRHFSAPPATRGRVDGRVQYCWEGYSIASDNNQS